MKLGVTQPKPRCATRRGAPSRFVLRRPQGVLSSGLTVNNQNFVTRHKEVLDDSEWYGPETPDHLVSPAAVAAMPATATNRNDIRLMTRFTTYLKSHKINLSSLFCTEPILSADAAVVCDLKAGHHGELLSEYLTAGNMRVGEELPHWFVNGNIRGAIKCWMATRPAAAAPAEQQPQQQQAEASLVASVVRQGLLGAMASRLVDPLLAAMPAWRPEATAEMAGWEAAAAATAEDVALLHCFGAIVYASRLDVDDFLQQLCGADPFSWAAAQVAVGAISEPEPWLLERFFLSRHVEGEQLPLWFVTWKVRDEVRQWLEGPQAAALVGRLLQARGLASVRNDSTGPDSGSSLDEAAALAAPCLSEASADEADAAAGMSPALAAALDLLEASAASLMVSVLPGSTAPPLTCRRGALLSHPVVEGQLPVSYLADLVVRCGGGGGSGAGALVAVALQTDSAKVAAAVAVRQAKERLDWLDFLISEERGVASVGAPEAAVAKVLVLVTAGGEGVHPQQQQYAALSPVLLRYLSQAGVQCLTMADLARR